MAESPPLSLTTADGWTRLTAVGEWTAMRAVDLEAVVDAAIVDRPATGRAEIDLTGVNRLDTLGARLIERLRHDLTARGAVVSLRVRDKTQQSLIDEVAERSSERMPPPPDQNAFVDLLADMGAVIRGMGRDVVEATAFAGDIVATVLLVPTRHRRLRWPAIITQMERMIFRGVPIIALISFLVGCIIAQQTIFQLERFGASLFVVDLIGILFLREVGLLLAAIMIAGRSGSAITAEIGSMRMREEIDAMRVMGLNPIEVLVLPRLIALLIGLPLLTFIASMSGIIGGGLTAWLYGDISPASFLSRLREAIALNTFMVGLIKAPFMALIIAIIACNEGFKVKGSAESLGRRTTSSVVKAIFMVIVVDGLFAMFFGAIRY
jgi:phospholipid/cholesterol/gamma-HCH transport system permease protein